MIDFPFRNHSAFRMFKKLTTPEKIQDFLDSMPINFEPDGETCASPLVVLERNSAHCIEGALVAAAALWYHGDRPLLLDLKTAKDDHDHVVALFKRNGRWGAISKTNHAVLRYRDAVYASPRELAMSYFHEYFLDSGEKTLRSYSAPFNLLAYEHDWLISRENLWGIHDDLDDARHFPIAPPVALRRLRPASSVERKAGTLTEWKKPRIKNQE